MPEMRHPLLGSVVNVADASVEKFTRIGYVALEEKSQPKAPAKKSASSKSSK